MKHHHLSWRNLITIYTTARINGGYSRDNGSRTARHSGEIKVTFVDFTLYHLRHKERRFFLMQNAYTRRWQEHHDDGVFFPPSRCLLTLHENVNRPLSGDKEFSMFTLSCFILSLAPSPGDTYEFHVDDTSAKKSLLSVCCVIAGASRDKHVAWALSARGAEEKRTKGLSSSSTNKRAMKASSVEVNWRI